MMSVFEILVNFLFGAGEVASVWEIPADAPPLKFHNTLSGKLEVFTPLSGPMVKMYNCGPTPYDQQHIGNMVPPLLADTLRRTLTAWGYQVKQVMNITDFGHLTGDNEGDPNIGDDKMTKGLAREGLTPTMANMRVLAEKYAKIFFDDVQSLGVNTKRVIYPRASDYIPEQIALIKTLEQKGYTYKTSDGIYYDTSKFATYGALGNINLAGLQEGARVHENSEKKNQKDFVLWKISSGLGWESPWGKGFPGWHIECTAMIFKLLGKQIDIHTGGIEHIPIHHNNEIAQAEAATGKKFVQYWLHNAHITIEGRKISKSLGNTVYVHNIVDRGFSPRAFRYWFLTGHYRTPMNFTWDAIEGADTALKRLTHKYLELPDGGIRDDQFLKNFYAALAEDLNTASALSMVWALLKDENITLDDRKATLAEMDNIFGFGLADARPEHKLTVVAEKDLPENMQTLVKKRAAAREAKNFEQSDTLRADMQTLGYTVKDTAEGQIVTKN